MHTVHPGNVAETKTLQAMLATVLERFPIQRVILVADRGLLSLLWLPPVMQEVFDPFGCDRVRTSFRPRCAALPEAAGRYGDQRVGSKSVDRALSSQL